MIGGGYWYIEGADGVHYCYAKTPTYTCPYYEGLEAEAAATRDLVAAAAVLGLSKLSRIIRDAHRRHYVGTSQGLRERTEAGKLTEKWARKQVAKSKAAA